MTNTIPPSRDRYTGTLSACNERLEECAVQPVDAQHQASVPRSGANLTTGGQRHAPNVESAAGPFSHSTTVAQLGVTPSNPSDEVREQSWQQELAAMVELATTGLMALALWVALIVLVLKSVGVL